MSRTRHLTWINTQSPSHNLPGGTAMIAYSAEIGIANHFDGEAIVTLFHTNSHFGARRAQWTIPAGETAGALAAAFDDGSTSTASRSTGSGCVSRR